MRKTCLERVFSLESDEGYLIIQHKNKGNLKVLKNLNNCSVNDVLKGMRIKAHMVAEEIANKNGSTVEDLTEIQERTYHKRSKISHRF